MNDLEFKNWVQRSQDDIRAAKVLLEKRILPWIICFHCQQAVEKYLKAVQVVYLKNYEKEHDLVKLAKTVSQIIDLDSLLLDLSFLSAFYIAGRYPTVQETTITVKRAEEVFNLTKKVLKVLKDNLNKT